MPDQHVRGNAAEPAPVGNGPIGGGQARSEVSSSRTMGASGDDPGSSSTQRSPNSYANSGSADPKINRTKPSDTLRRSQACLACRKRKLRCDARKPTCTRCEKAWLAYHDTHETAESSRSVPPPCEYDTSLLAKIFLTSSSNDGANSSLPSPTASRARDAAQQEQADYAEYLSQQNEELRAQIARLEHRLTHSHTGSDPTWPRAELLSTSDGPRVEPVSDSAVRISVQELTSVDFSSEPFPKRIRYSDDRAASSSTLRGHSAVLPRDQAGRPGNDIYAQERRSSSSEAGSLPLEGTLGLPQRPSSGPRPGYGWQAAPHHLDSTARLSPVSMSPSQLTIPPTPDRDTLNGLIDLCEREAWLFGAINSYALRDVVALLETGPDTNTDTIVARAMMFAVVATGLPLLARVYASGISSSPIFARIDALLRPHFQLGRSSSNVATTRVSTVANIYADAARLLLNRVQPSSESQTLAASFVARILLAESSLGQSAVCGAQADLVLAVSEARMLALHHPTSAEVPHLGKDPNRPSHLSRALRGLMMGSEERFAFWSLFTQDCFQSRLASLQVVLERQGIKIGFPNRAEPQGPLSAQNRAEEVEDPMQRGRGLPAFRAPDGSMTLLVKMVLVLDQCCEYSNIERQRLDLRSEHDRSLTWNEMRDNLFIAAHEAIRNSRLMLSNFDERVSARTPLFDQPGQSERARESVVASVVLRDPLRFAAEVTHHLAVLSLFEGAIDVAAPHAHDAPHARDMICNAALWLSRLAEMAVQHASVLLGAPAFCSTALFIGARWLLFLQLNQPNETHQDISAIVLALWERAAAFNRDHVLAKAIVALEKERYMHGRICVSPFAWPIEAVSRFVPVDTQVATHGRGQPMPSREASFVSIATLAASIDEAEVAQFLNGADRR